MANEYQLKNHWMQRTSVNRRRVQNIAAYSAAHELALIKEEIKKLASREQELKEKLTNVLELGDYIELESHEELDSDYVVEFIEIGRRRGLHRSKTLRYIEKRFGTEAALGVEENCSFSQKPLKAVFVRPFSKELGNSSSNSRDSNGLFPDEDMPF